MSLEFKRSNVTGMYDRTKIDMEIYNMIVTNIKNEYSLNTDEQLDTPVLERYETVKDIYGHEFTKSVFWLADLKSIMRYDFTVPLCRYVGANGLEKFRRYQIGKVYRSDDPEPSKGRFSEFTQADFDIVGSDQGTNMHDLEILELASRTLNKLIGDTFTIRLNDRNLLFALLKNFGVHEKSCIHVASVIDKLDKKTVDEIYLDLKSMRSIDEKTVENIKEFILMVKDSTDAKVLMEKVSAMVDTSYMSTLLKQVEELKIKNVVFYPLLARGLDYYTGMIFETFYKDPTVITSSICAGGRYDKLIGRFSNKGDIPAIGVSIGVDRILTIVKATTGVFKSKKIIYIASIGPKNKDPEEEMSILLEKQKLAMTLRSRGVSVMMSHLRNPNMAVQLEEALNGDMKLMVILGKNEIKNGLLRLKYLETKSQMDLPHAEAILRILSL